ncbi:MAG: GNAT family N-acetyltransferase [Bdellovibrionota bacterium]
MKSSLVLRKLTATDESAFFRAHALWNDPRLLFASAYRPGMPFPELLTALEDCAAGKNLLPGKVADTVVFGFVDGGIVGRLSIRHELNEFLRTIGGHIGYGVLEEHRRRGYATEMLRQSLPMARAIGIDRALLTCDDDNAASFKTIESCGGILENKVMDEDRRVLKRRYWIDLY